MELTVEARDKAKKRSVPKSFKPTCEPSLRAD